MEGGNGGKERMEGRRGLRKWRKVGWREEGDKVRRDGGKKGMEGSATL